MKSKRDFVKDKAFVLMGSGAYTKAHGTKTSAMVKVTRDSAMGISTWEIMRWAKSRVKASTRGRAGILTMENGSMESSMAMEFGLEQPVTNISDSGYRIKHMVMDSTNGQMAIDTRVNGSSVYVMVRAQTHSPMVMCISVSITMAKPMVMANTDGRTGTPTQASLSRA